MLFVILNIKFDEHLGREYSTRPTVQTNMFFVHDK